MNYTKEQLSQMSVNQLQELREHLSQEVANSSIQEKTLKITMNSLYGAFANNFFILCNPDVAASMTASGRFFLHLLARNIEQRLQKLQPNPEKYICYGDTDSIYYTIEPFVIKKFGTNVQVSDEVLDWCNQFEINIIQKIVQDTIEQYAKILNIYTMHSIGIGREIIADAGVFVAKKRYFVRVRDNEGVRYDINHPYIKVMGLEIVRSSTPPWIRKHLKNAIEVILDRDDAGLRKWRDEIKAEFPKQDINEICMTAGISNFNYSLTDKGIPIGVRSALVHNNYVQTHGLTAEIELLKPGEKYKRCYLKTPNRFNSDVISFADDKIAKIIAEDDIYDYTKNFNAYFEAPLETMVKSLDYNIKFTPVTAWF